ncbi:glycoside hydrolase family 15 protein [Oceanobacillus halophilus]|uniref:Glycoside hydrolase family 15 n=1 Tax=Oceanobacillus halophilus TaxID=930130 RepID=A0A495A758_9BACI|nr:glycoside hydrolase family 15 protein [Oceanobacillus halophilus]RKQ35618.1 glycoside hydrolase family 15 [Oceanobacillus halophilus]
MRKKPYLIDGIIGNGSMLVSLTKDGEIQRLNWPRIDSNDRINRQWAGILIEDQTKPVYFHEESFNHSQSYMEDSNILLTSHIGKGVKVNQVDYVLPNENVLVRNFEIKNMSSNDLPCAFVYFSDSALSGSTRFQTTKFQVEEDQLIHYHRNETMVITATETITAYQSGKALQQLEQNQLEGRTILNDSEGAFTIDLGTLKAEETKKLTIYITMEETEEAANKHIKQLKQNGEEELRAKTLNYWSSVLKKRNKYNIQSKKVDGIYKRSILTFHLLQNKQTGAFIAGPEVDEDYDYSGGYAYCWGRDAAFIASAVDAAGYHHLVSKFYRFMISIQSKDGSWDQRHYTDGVLAPTWGLQIDETGSILWGIHQHYLVTNDEDFRNEIWPSVRKGANFLCSFIDPNTKLPKPSKDLWEKRTGEHLYSAAAVYGGLIGSAEIAELQGEEQLAVDYRKCASELKEAVSDVGWNHAEQRFNRSLKLTVTKDQFDKANRTGKRTSIEKNSKNVSEYILLEDATPDISLLGLNYPFQMIDDTDIKFSKTVQTIEDTCTSKHVGGLERFPGDVYIGGNPWLISTLWLAIHKERTSDHSKSNDLFNWATEHANHLGLLPEQIDKKTNEPSWVMPLTWSHAMYVLAIKEFTKKGSI